MNTPRRGKDRLAIALGKVIADERRQRGLSQEALAQKSGISLAYVSQVERGVKGITVRLLADVAEAMGGRASDFLKRAESELVNPTEVSMVTGIIKVKRRLRS